jgi:hypothetical protein
MEKETFKILSRVRLMKHLQGQYILKSDQEFAACLKVFLHCYDVLHSLDNDPKQQDRVKQELYNLIKINSDETTT